MRWKTTVYVAAIAVLARSGALECIEARPLCRPSMLTDALASLRLAVTAELLSFLLPRSAAGSIGFIPYFAAAIVVPAWPSVLRVVARQDRGRNVDSSGADQGGAECLRARARWN